MKRLLLIPLLFSLLFGCEKKQEKEVDFEEMVQGEARNQKENRL